ncbi:M48 family metallopeptidase [Candidatus Gottesmanbacteria bacterium]|nr:M48 family metallopeptidase [Candidatus Gottesmanbacteria bacterium]
MRTDFIIKRLSRRSISLHILENGELEVRAPRFIPEFIIRQFVAAKEDWIEQTRLKLKTLPKSKKPVYKEGEVFRLGGKEYTLHITDGNAVVLTPTRLYFPKKFLSRAKHHMELFCRKFAKQFLTERVSVYAEKMKVTCRRISIRDTTSRWGSCSSTGTISFSYRLILAELSIIDYVVAHELAHVTHHHHKPAFWAYLSRYYPGYITAKTWLRREGHTLKI